jgi:8-oxo-dGTP pyrophosphatase MutT (NUDIX family)
VTSADDPVRVRDAATVVLLRDGTDGIETWLLSRVARMAFASGVAVFPGGAVDASDAALPWSGRDADAVAESFGCSLEMARALVGAAVREVFEETGILLTVPRCDLSAAQPDVEAGRISFGELLLEHGLCIEAEAVRAWAHWITPVGETSRRYDTRFFVAALPADAVAADLTTESSHASWVPVRRALADRSAGVTPMMPPTLSVLASIAEFDTVAEVIAATEGRTISAITPIIRTVGDRRVVELPDGSTIMM